MDAQITECTFRKLPLLSGIEPLLSRRAIMFQSRDKFTICRLLLLIGDQKSYPLLGHAEHEPILNFGQKKRREYKDLEGSGLFDLSTRSILKKLCD